MTSIKKPDFTESATSTQVTKTRFVHDQIHGDIKLDPRIAPIVDTPFVQRLRKLKQLGTTYWVFPGGSHNRFEHSLGVMYLAGVVMEKLKEKQPDLYISSSDIFCVKVAGLLHDIGHGPFSHVFDNEFVPRAIDHIIKTEGNLDKYPALKKYSDDNKFTHEEMSTKIVDFIFKDDKLKKKYGDLELPFPTKEEIELIKALICPKRFNHTKEYWTSKNKYFLFQIIANEETGMDVDKCDYLLRDSENCKIKITFDYHRLFEGMRVSKDKNYKLIYQEKAYLEAYTLFNSRYELFKRVYSHKTSKAIEYMYVDALLKADKLLHIVQKITDVEQYLKLDDSIIDMIEKLDTDLLVGSNEAKKEFNEAKKILEKVTRRELYTPAAYFLFSPTELTQLMSSLESENDDSKDDSDDDDAPSTPKSKTQKSGINTTKSLNDDIEDFKRKCEETLRNIYLNHGKKIDDYKSFNVQMEVTYKPAKFKLSKFSKIVKNMLWKKLKEKTNKLNKDDFIIHLMDISYGMGDTNPLGKVDVFTNDFSNVKQVDPSQGSKVIGVKSQEIIFRAFVKNKKK